MPPLGRHGIRDVVDVERLGVESHDADQRLAHDLQVVLQARVCADRRLELLGGANDGVASVDVPLFPHRHHAGPAAGDEGARSGAGDADGAIDAAGPVRRDEVLVGSEGSGAVEKRRIAFWSEAVLVGVAADARDAFQSEVEWLSWETSAGQEGHEERAKTAVDMQGKPTAEGEAGESCYVVDDAMREIRRRADKKNGVAVDEARDRFGGDGIGRRRAGNEMDFDLEVGTRFMESCMCGIGYNPGPSLVNLIEKATTGRKRR